MAVANYESVHKKLPPHSTSNGFSWRVEILPYIEEKALYRSLDHSSAWDSATNSAFHLTVPHGVKCHNRDDESANTQMFAITSANSVWKPGGTVYEEITDERTETLMFIELDLPDRNWMSPTNVSLSDLIEMLRRDGRLPSLHPDGVLMSFADVSVRCIPHEKITPEFLRAIVSINSGEEVEFD